MASPRVTFDEVLADVGEKLTQLQQWQRELAGLRETSASESGAVAVEVDAFGVPSRLWLDPSALKLRPAELGRQIVDTFDAAAAELDGRRGELDRELTQETSTWEQAGTAR